MQPKQRATALLLFCMAIPATTSFIVARPMIKPLLAVALPDKYTAVDGDGNKFEVNVEVSPDSLTFKSEDSALKKAGYEKSTTVFETTTKNEFVMVLSTGKGKSAKCYYMDSPKTFDDLDGVVVTNNGKEVNFVNEVSLDATGKPLKQSAAKKFLKTTKSAKTLCKRAKIYEVSVLKVDADLTNTKNLTTVGPDSFITLVVASGNGKGKGNNGKGNGKGNNGKGNNGKGNNGKGNNGKGKDGKGDNGKGNSPGTNTKTKAKVSSKSSGNGVSPGNIDKVKAKNNNNNNKNGKNKNNKKNKSNGGRSSGNGKAKGNGKKNGKGKGNKNKNKNQNKENTVTTTPQPAIQG